MHLMYVCESWTKTKQPLLHSALCEDLFFPAEKLCMSHLREQHSGISYKCKKCKKIFRRNDNPHSCRANKADYILFNQQTEAKGTEAEDDLKIFLDRVKTSLCIDLERTQCEKKHSKTKVRPPKRTIKFDFQLSDSESSDSDNEGYSFEKFQIENFENEIQLLEIEEEEKKKKKKDEKQLEENTRKEQREKKKEEERIKREEEKKREEERIKLEEENEKEEEERIKKEKKKKKRKKDLKWKMKENRKKR